MEGLNEGKEMASVLIKSINIGIIALVIFGPQVEFFETAWTGKELSQDSSADLQVFLRSEIKKRKHHE